MNTERLTDLQRRNLAAIRIKRAQMRTMHGDNIQIVDTDDEVLRRRGPMAVPASALIADKQITIVMDNILEKLDGTTEVVSTKDQQRGRANTEDVIVALERTADIYEQQLAAKERKYTAKPVANKFEVPAGYKLVPIEEEANPVAAAAPGEVFEMPQLGVSVPREPVKRSDAEVLDELLA